MSNYESDEGRRRRSRSPRNRRSRSRSPRRNNNEFGYRRPRSRSPVCVEPPTCEDRWISTHPTNTILMRGLPDDMNDFMLKKHLIDLRIPIKDVRMIRKRDGGQNGLQVRSFAFCEFGSTADAQRWLTNTQGSLWLDECLISLFFGSPRSGIVLLEDWVCLKCTAFNYKHRDLCFRCRDPRPPQGRRDLDLDGGEHVGKNACNTLLVRGLDGMTSEGSVIEALQRVTTSTIRNCHVMLDPMTGQSRYYAFVELNTAHDASALLDAVIRLRPPFEIDGKQVVVSFSKNTFCTVMAQLTSTSRAPNAYAAGGNGSAQVAYGQQQRQQVDTSSFTYDANSGYYYDPSTGYYYDTSTGYFYNNATQQWIYYDHQQQQYLPVPDAAATAIMQHGPEPQPSAERDREDKKEKQKKAKQIQKDMERWARMQNKSKKGGIAAMPQAQVMAQQQEAATADVCYAVMEQAQAPTLVSYEEEAPPVEEIVPDFADWEQNICKLCVRKLASAAALQKHTSQSELHATNLRKWCDENGVPYPQAKSAPPQQVEVPATFALPQGSMLGMGGEYRDRAKERREKIGSVPPPPDKLNRFRSAAEAASRQVEYVMSNQNGNNGAPAQSLKSDNAGHKLLQKMGWEEGKGLGKNHSGIVDPLQAEMRRQGVGLGASGSKMVAGQNAYSKSGVRQTQLDRYKEDRFVDHIFQND